MIVKRMKVEKLEIENTFGPRAHLQGVKPDGKMEHGTHMALVISEDEQQALHLGQVLEVTVAVAVVEEATHV